MCDSRARLSFLLLRFSPHIEAFKGVRLYVINFSIYGVVDLFFVYTSAFESLVSVLKSHLSLEIALLVDAFVCCFNISVTAFFKT